MNKTKIVFSLLLPILLSCSASRPEEKSAPPPLAAATRKLSQLEGHVASGKHYALAAQGKGAAAAAEEIYSKGGNIIDAAVAVSFAISVERPQSTGLGGGGFLLFHEAKTGKTQAVDFRERAPFLAKRDMYLDSKGEFLSQKSLNGYSAVATPGLVAGLLEVHHKWGKLSLNEVITPALRLAEEGVEVTPDLHDALKIRHEVIKRDPGAKAIFLKPDSSLYQPGEKLIQKDLASTLRLIAREGRAGFYKGKVARAIVRASKANGGFLQQKDFDSYQVKWREPLHGTFRDLEVYSMPPPSSGGIHVLQILNILETDPLREFGFLSTQAVHLTASAMQQAFADRSEYPGDPDFVQVPVSKLLSKEYARQQRARINENRARPSSEVKPGLAGREESFETTHFSILDSEGNSVASTQTVNYLFGAGVVAPGTGVLLNDEMDDFAAKPGAANVFGALGGEANSIAPGKTPLSSMSPTIIMKKGTPVMVVGAPGGTRIISCVANTILHYFAYGFSPFEAVAVPRMHHQWMPDRLDIEAPGPGAFKVRELERMGYHVRVSDEAIPCRVELVVREGDQLIGVSDPRDYGRSLAK